MSHLLVLVLVLVSRELVMVSVSVLLQPGLDYNTASSLVILGSGLGLDKCDLIDITELSGHCHATPALSARLYIFNCTRYRSATLAAVTYLDDTCVKPAGKTDAGTPGWSVAHAGSETAISYFFCSIFDRNTRGQAICLREARLLVHCIFCCRDVRRPGRFRPICFHTFSTCVSVHSSGLHLFIANRAGFGKLLT